MNKRLNLPEIPDSERTPLVDALLGIIESLPETVPRQDEEIGRLKDGIAILKGEKARPIQAEWHGAGNRWQAVVGNRRGQEKTGGLEEAE